MLTVVEAVAVHPLLFCTRRLMVYRPGLGAFQVVRALEVEAKLPPEAVQEKLEPEAPVRLMLLPTQTLGLLRVMLAVVEVLTSTVVEAVAEQEPPKAVTLMLKVPLPMLLHWVGEPVVEVKLPPDESQE
jgi:hypothetical protein